MPLRDKSIIKQTISGQFFIFLLIKYSLSFLVWSAFFIPLILTNQRQLFRVLNNHRRVFLQKKKSAVNDKTRAVDILKQFQGQF